MVKASGRKAAYARDYTKYLYFVGKDGYVWRKRKGTKKGLGMERVPGAPSVSREPGYLYYVEKTGGIGRKPIGGR